MKNTLTTILCLLLSAVLAVGAVCLGARNSWLKEREKAISTFSGDESTDSFENRAMDTANLYVVAARHLPADNPLLTALQECRATLQSTAASSAEKAQADITLTATAQALASTLEVESSVHASVRDQVYITTLTRTLTQGRDAAAYALSAQDFNRRLQESLTGKLAMMLGVPVIDVP